MLRTASSLPLTGLSTLGSGPARFPAEPPACYRASWQLPGPDFHRQATTSLRTARSAATSQRHLPLCWAHEKPGLAGVSANVQLQAAGRHQRPAPHERPAGQQASHLAIQQCAFCTATCSTSAKNSARIPAKPTTCCLYRLPIGEFPPAAKPRPILASYDGATELECGLGILLTGLTTTLIPGDVMPPQPIRPFGRSSADGIRDVNDWAAVPCTRSSGSRRSS
jgi:hypothetical protein